MESAPCPRGLLQILLRGVVRLVLRSSRMVQPGASPCCWPKYDYISTASRNRKNMKSLLPSLPQITAESNRNPGSERVWGIRLPKPEIQHHSEQEGQF